MENSTTPKKLRNRYENFFAPVGKLLAKTGLTPNIVSVLSVFISFFSCIAFSLSQIIGIPQALIIGTIFLGFSSLLDMLDGSLARALGTAGYYGALLDRTLDRVSEFFFLLGIMIGGYVYPEWVFICFEGMILASYVRSTAENRGGLKMDSTTGIFERKEKLTLLAVGCLVEAIFIENFLQEVWTFNFGVLALIVLLIGIISNISAIQRLEYARKFYTKSPK